jgi:hypothetical protein
MMLTGQRILVTAFTGRLGAAFADYLAGTLGHSRSWSMLPCRIREPACREKHVAKVSIDLNLCSGHVTCHAAHPGLFQFDERLRAARGG